MEDESACSTGCSDGPARGARDGVNELDMAGPRLELDGGLLLYSRRQNVQWENEVERFCELCRPAFFLVLLQMLDKDNVDGEFAIFFSKKQLKSTSLNIVSVWHS